MEKGYNSQLEPIFRRHPQFMPFVGEEYEKHRLLVIGESHYIRLEGDKKVDSEEWRTPAFFNGWWEDNWADTNEKKTFMEVCGKHFDTRKVVEQYFGDNPTQKMNRGFFLGASKLLWGALKGVEPDKIPKQERPQIFQQCAYMNFFQIPVFSEGQGIKAFFPKDDLGKNEVESFCIVQRAIQALDPSIVLFLSSYSADVYERESKQRPVGLDDEMTVRPILIHSCHPARSSWYRKVKRYSDFTYQCATKGLLVRALEAGEK